MEGNHHCLPILLLTGLVVLRAVAWAHELVLGLVPGDDTTQVSAHGVEAVALDGLVLLDDQVGGITLKTLFNNNITSIMVGLVKYRCDTILPTMRASPTPLYYDAIIPF